ncbi:DnaJ domain-containing protein [Alkalibaculum bacchi]|uniref:J domain-containing protein n=1 Tax=Alkalibaculum bacchi TaxID=645887 RepID=UPI0026F141C7|nr:DnaJ domain-containing protein [Alkalibaculum bacchi]
MNSIKKISGKVLYAITSVISGILDVIIGIIDFTVNLVNTIAQGLLAILGMGGCLFAFFLLGPYALFLLFNPVVILILLFFVVFPILGTKFVSFLKYIKYASTEFLFDRANNLMYGTENKYETFSEYGYGYKREQEDKRQKEQQERQYQQQKEWEEKFKQWQSFQNSQRTYHGQGNYGGYRQNTGYGGQSYVNPSIEFKKKYEESCSILEVSYQADKYQIKLAYRKKAKEYHPDINQSPNATKMFQKINDAYEFLSESNIERYKKL